MNFRFKLLIGIFITFVFFFFASDLIAKKLIFSDFDKLEHDYAVSDMGRVLYFVNDSFSNYDDVCRDWATWDDTYAFVRDRNEKFRQGNLLPQTFDNLRVHLIMMLDEKGRTVYSSGYDNSTDTLYPLAPSDEKALAAGFACRSIVKGTQGIILMPQGAMLVNARPIIKSDRSGPIRGTLLMGRYFDAFRLKRLTSVTHLYAQVYSLNQGSVPGEIKAVLPALAASPIKLINRQELMVGYLLMNDVFRRPALVFRVEMPRPLYFQSQMFSSLLSIVRLASFFFTGLATLLILQIIIVWPLNRANKDLTQVVGYCDLTGEERHPAARDKDELGTLQSSVDNILKTLEQRRRRENKPDRDPEP
jgi:sensor domain CHASE-containing protein